MTVTDRVYSKALKNLSVSQMVTGPLKVSLHGTAYVPARSADESYADLTGEISGTGYTAGGATVATADVSAVVDGTAHTLALLIANPTTWASATVSGVRTAVLRSAASTAPAEQYLIAYRTLSDDSALRGATNATFAVPWPSGGVFRIQLPGG
jgi:hypothetical protein